MEYCAKVMEYFQKIVGQKITVNSVIMLSLAIFSFLDRRVNLENFSDFFRYLTIRYLQINFQKFQYNNAKKITS